VSIINYFNPLKYVPSKKYVGFWKWFFSTVFYGLCAKFLALCFFVLGMWLAIRKQRLGAAAFFYLLAFIFTYGGGLLKIWKFLP